MLKAWLNIWPNAFNYTGKVSRKDYWWACIVHIAAMFIFAIPCGLMLRFLPISAETGSALFLIAFNIPMVALYFRRANDANWKPITTLFMAIGTPILSSLVVGVFPSLPKEAVWPRFYSVCGKLFALSFGLFFYGGVLGIILFDDVTAIPALSSAGLLLGSGTLIYVGYKMFFEK